MIVEVRTNSPGYSYFYYIWSINKLNLNFDRNEVVTFFLSFLFFSFFSFGTTNSLRINLVRALVQQKGKRRLKFMTCPFQNVILTNWAALITTQVINNLLKVFCYIANYYNKEQIIYDTRVYIYVIYKMYLNAFHPQVTFVILS